MPEKEPLGTRIRRIRQERGMTQDSLALKAKVDQSGLSKLERGMSKKMGPFPLSRIAHVLDVSFDDLVTGTDFRGH